MPGADYVKLADTLAADIAAGRLKAGDRLLPQRTFAYRHDIAVSTASRVYAELVRRGLAAGEVGRGTYILGTAPRAALPPEVHGFAHRSGVQLPDPAGAVRPDGADAGGPGSEQCPGGRLEAGRPQRHGRRARRGGAVSRHEGWRPKPEGLFFTGNGRQAIASAIGALVPVGGRLGVEAITYPVVKANARRLGVTLVPLAMDEAGLRPDAIEKAHREGALSGRLPAAAAAQSPGRQPLAGSPARHHQGRTEARPHAYRGRGLSLPVR